jgi:hypothetical protein
MLVVVEMDHCAELCCISAMPHISGRATELKLLQMIKFDFPSPHNGISFVFSS